SAPPPTAKAYARLSGSRCIAAPCAAIRRGCTPCARLSSAAARPRGSRLHAQSMGGMVAGTKNPAGAGFVSHAAIADRSVADLLLQVLPALLLVDGALGGEAGFEALEADLLAGVDAVAVLARVHPLERAVDLADQLAVAVAGAQFQRVLGFTGGALGLVADVAHFVLEVLDGLLGFLDQVRAPLQQALAEVLELQRAHVFLAGAGPVTLRQDRATGRFVDLVRHHLVLGLRSRRRRPGHDGD